MYFHMVQEHLTVFMIFTLIGAIATAVSLVCLYRRRSRQLFKPDTYTGEDLHGYFAASRKLSTRIHRVRTAYAGIPSGIAGALFAGYCTALYYSAAEQPHLTELQLLAKTGCGLAAALALLIVTRGVIRFAEYSNYQTLVGITRTISCIAGVAVSCLLVFEGLTKLLDLVPLPIIFIGALAIMGLGCGVAVAAQDHQDAVRQQARTAARSNAYSIHLAEMQMAERAERQRIEREENIRLDVLERRLGRRLK